ncbi:hypothetical protein K3495_g16215 [Podosphaera aphanis]|nr:hypothetical protein K3495_g16215 [Podosphaera aphanis]
MDDTFRDRNAEQVAASLFYACRQFKDENLASFLPRFQLLLARSPSSSGEDQNKVYQLRNALNKTTLDYLVGRAKPNKFLDFIEYLSTVGAEIEEVGRFKTKAYSIGDIGVFDDGTRGIAGGKILSSTAPPISAYRPQQNPVTHQKDADGDVKMTGVFKIRAKWVPSKELERRRKEGLCIRCGNKGHHIALCHFLPPERPETAVKSTSMQVQQIETGEDCAALEESLKG